jgi:signal peptide peptidase SppA
VRRAVGAAYADDTPLDNETQDRLPARAAADRRQRDAQGGVAVLPLHGVISPRVHDVEGVSTGGGASAEGFAAALRALAADSAVTGIVIDVDSPGGNVLGIPEAVAAVREAREVKPVTAVAHHWAASAAYWIASAAGELVVTPSGEVGSIGVYAYHEDLSKRFEMLGVKPTLIKAGTHKAEGHPAFPLGEEAAAYAQEQVNAIYGAFVRDVAKGRGVPVATVRDSFGDGRMVAAQEAVRRGMADRVDSLANTIKRMQRGAGKSKDIAAGHDMRRRRLAVA